MTVKIDKRLSYWVDFGNIEHHGFVEATMWTNGEGFDFEVDSWHNLGSRRIQLTWDELDALKEILDKIYEGEDE